VNIRATPILGITHINWRNDKGHGIKEIITEDTNFYTKLLCLPDIVADDFG